MKDQAPSTDRDGELAGSQAFQGFKLPTSSTTYTPNQFFDVVLPHASRGCLRLVAYIIRKTLGWSDEHGNPQNPNAHVTYRELIENAGISRGAIKEAIAEAMDKRFIDAYSHWAYSRGTIIARTDTSAKFLRIGQGTSTAGNNNPFGDPWSRYDETKNDGTPLGTTYICAVGTVNYPCFFLPDRERN